jgi:hypothetical protein
MVASWSPFLGKDLAEQRAQQRLRQTACFSGLLSVEVVLFITSEPTFESRTGARAQVAVLVTSLLVSYALPLLFFFTWRIRRVIRARLAMEGIQANQTAPLHSRRSFSKWTSHLHVSQEQLVRILEKPQDATTR